MKYDKKTLIFLPVLSAVVAIIGYFLLINNNVNEDATKFKNEYEKYNDMVAYGNIKYSILNIKDNNPIKYSEYDQLLDIIKNKTGIIYLGFPECPWCRSMLPVLLEVAEDYKIDTIYYLNIKNERDSYIVEDNQLVYAKDENGNEIKGTEGYFKLLESLDEHLTEYTISYKEKVYETGEKRIYAPTVIFVKNGEILGLHVSTVESQKSGFDKLTNEQKEELYSIFEEYIYDMVESSCSSDSAC